MKIKSFLIIVLLFNLFFVSEVYCANTHKKASITKKSQVKSKTAGKKKQVSKNANLINSLYNCSNYTRVTDTRIVQVLGWANRKCNYREINSSKTVDCAFSSAQYQQLKNDIKNTKNKAAINSLSDLNSYKILYLSACKSGNDDEDSEENENNAGNPGVGTANAQN